VEKLYAVIGMFGNAGKDTIFKVAAGDEGGTRTTLFYGLKGSIIALLSLGIILVQGRSLVDLVTIPWAVPLGVLCFVTYTFALKSLVGGDASTSVTVFRLNFVLSTAAAALFLGESITVRKLAGLVLSLAAMLIFFVGSRADEHTTSPRAGRVKSLLFALAACVCATLLNTINKVALNAGVSILHLIMYRYVVVCAICAAWLGMTRQSFAPTRRLAIASGSCAVLMLVSLLSTLTGLSVGEVSVVIPITSLSFLFTALLSFLFLHERLSATKIIGIVLAAASITIIG
jgi:transporter family protein